MHAPEGGGQKAIATPKLGNDWNVARWVRSSNRDACKELAEAPG